MYKAYRGLVHLINDIVAEPSSLITVEIGSTRRQGMFIAKALYFGQAGVKRNYAKQIRNIVSEAYKKLGEVPIVIGETGIPMDMK